MMRGQNILKPKDTLLVKVNSKKGSGIKSIQGSRSVKPAKKRSNATESRGILEPSGAWRWLSGSRMSVNLRLSMHWQEKPVQRQEINRVSQRASSGSA